MNSATKRPEIHCLQGFDVHFLRNENIEVAAVPALGAKIISLRNLKTGREWMAAPRAGLKLFRNQPGDDFCASTLAGLDECIPTILPCRWNGAALPDHGEAWSAEWRVEGDAWSRAKLRTHVGLRCLPLDFGRTIELAGNEARLDYTLSNRGDREESFLWAMHPLLNLQTGDCLDLPASTRALMADEAWLHSLYAGINEGACAKRHANPVQEGFAAVNNSTTGDRLELVWDSAKNNTLGIWITRGGWHGHHQFAIEPANGCADSLDKAGQNGHCGRIPPGGSISWSVVMRVAP